ncbi:hypothetical protein ES705_12535 [subsurface metagenome]
MSRDKFENSSTTGNDALDTVEAVSTEISTNSERIYFYAFVVCNDFGGR